MSNETAKEVLRNAFKHAAKLLTLVELQQLFCEVLMEIHVEKIKEIDNHPLDAIPAIKVGDRILITNQSDSSKDGVYECGEEISDEADWKQLDDAQRYRDLKS